MEKSWVKSYPKGVPAEINAEAYKNLNEVFSTSARRYLGRPAFINMGKTLSYSDLDKLSRDFAAFLQNDLGLKKGDRIAMQMPNILQYPVCLFGALRAGLTVVNTNPLYTAPELKHQFNDSGAETLVVMSNFAHNVEKIIGETKIKNVIITDVGDLLGFPKKEVFNFVSKYVKKLVPAYNLPKARKFSECMSKGASLSFTEVDVKGSDLAFLQYTGGTTGVSKGAMLTHRNLIANTEQIYAWIGGLLEEGKEIVVTPLPLYHVFSLVVNCLAFMKIGAANLFITNPRDVPAFVKEMKKYPVSAITAVNTLFNALLNNEEFRNMDFSTFKVSVGGAMAVQSAVAEKWKKVTGLPLVEGYGLTEASPVICCNPIDGSERISTIGLPVPSTDVKIMGEDGKEVAFGETGEIWATGPQIMKGYWNRPDETAKTLQDGWLKTGDIAMAVSDGFYKIVDRKKDMILVSGFNVYPNEVEDVIAKMPGVLEVAAVGIPDEKSGEIVKVFVVKRDPALTEDQIKKFARENLTGYKCPRYVEFRNDLPKSNVGKILRRELRDNKPAAPAAADAPKAT